MPSFFFKGSAAPRYLPSFPPRRSSDLAERLVEGGARLGVLALAEVREALVEGAPGRAPGEQHGGEDDGGGPAHRARLSISRAICVECHFTWARSPAKRK